jgi:hypothetical protein
MVKTEAYKVVKRFHNGESNFDSDYTKSTSSGILTSNDEAILKDLSQRERIELSTKRGDFYELSLWKTIYLFIPKFDKWLLIHRDDSFNTNFSYCPEYVHINEDYLVSIGTSPYQIYKRISLGEL